MNIKKPLVIVGAVSAISAAGFVGSDLASAATNSSNGDTLVDKIASTFHLNKDDVQKVFDQDRADHQTQVNNRVESELSQAVKDGKITEDQKTKILAKRDELQKDREANRDSMKDKTHDQRKVAIDQKRTELEKWASDNNIPKEYLRYVAGGHGGPRGPGGAHPLKDKTN